MSCVSTWKFPFAHVTAHITWFVPVEDEHLLVMQL
jgi:hypothetical protein